jgi:hypothetical protein
VTTKVRLTNLESSLSPTRAVLLWYGRASQFGSISAYVRHCIDQPNSVADLDELNDQIIRFVRQTREAETPDEVARAVHVALRDGRFLFELVLESNSCVGRLRQLAQVHSQVLVSQLGDLLDDPRSFDVAVRRADPKGAASVDAGWRGWRDRTEALISAVRVQQAAMTRIDRRFFGGRAVLFPDLTEAWNRLTERVEWLAVVVGELREPYRTRAGLNRRRQRTTMLQSLEDQGALRARELIDAARIAAFDRLGDRQAALRLAERHLRRSGGLEA